MALDFEHARSRMIAEQLEARGFRDAAVLAAMRQVPRHLFVEPALSERAYEDTPLPIGERGRLVLPMGEDELQTLVRLRRGPEGLVEEYLGECRFVKLLGSYGWEET